MSPSTSSDSSSPAWGEWIGAWKANLSKNGVVDEEAERIDRQKAAFGGDTVARIKDLNVLILGCRGVGAETAKNLILSNVGSVTLWDPHAARPCDMGTNFYLTADDISRGLTLAQACLPDLKSLNPFCRVEIEEGSDITTDDYIANPNVAGTQRPFSAVVVTSLALFSKEDLFRMNEVCRKNGTAFIMAANHGVTASIFSDFGTNHEITDSNGEPTHTFAVSNVEVLDDDAPELLRVSNYDSGKSKTVVILTTSESHGLDDGDVIVIDDLGIDRRELVVQRVAFRSPSSANVDTSDVSFQELLKQPTTVVLHNLSKTFHHYQNAFRLENGEEKKMPVRTITMFNRLALVLDQQEENDKELIQKFASYQSGGFLQQVRKSVHVDYRSLEDTLESTAVPQMLRGEDWEEGKGIDIHLSVSTALNFFDKYKHWPKIRNGVDTNNFLDLATTLSKSRQDKEGSCWSQKVSYGFPTGEPRDLETSRIKHYAELFGTELTGLCAFLGGAAAQEVLKKTGKFTPINQWLHHDEQILVSDDFGNTSPVFGGRYDFQVSVLGKDFQAKAANQRVFLVGCGALGCEYLKGLALMGVATGKDGKVYVTDMDRIEVSNLSRQFLFRDSDVGHPKSVSGARVVKGWNPQMNVIPWEKKVGDDTEDFFNEEFWESLSVCWNALDNVMARKYTDGKCLLYSKPLLESGTLGTKCNHEVILPYRTSTYNDGKESDADENQIAMCTLRSFPYLPLHCIEFAKQAYFSDYFEFGPDQYEIFRKDTNGFLEQLEGLDTGEQYKSLSMIKFFIDLQNNNAGTISFQACIKVAFDHLIKDFRTSVLNLCHAADEMEASTGNKFWTGTKRRPRAVDWNDETEKSRLLEYLYCTSNMYAAMWGVILICDRTTFEQMVNDLNLKQPEWTPSNEDVDLNEGEGDENANSNGVDEAEEVNKLKSEMYSVDVQKLPNAFPHDFEKDDDSNFHIDFLTVATNLRAWNYDIKESPRHMVKVTAGKIIPALATTTAMVCGLVNIEFCKLVLGLQSSKGRDVFLNSNINLAAGSGNFTTFSPDPPVVLKTGLKAPYPESFSSWDKVDIFASNRDTELSVEQLVSNIETSFGVKVDRILEFGSTDALYNAVDKQKLNWEISFDEGGKPVVSDGVFTRWPNIRMAVQMLNRLPRTSGQRKMFEKQLNTTKLALDKTKESFMDTFQGPVSKAYYNVCRPKDEEPEKQEYFDKVFGNVNYFSFQIDCHQEGVEEDIHLPRVKYMFSRQNDDCGEEDEVHAMKRSRIEN